MRARPTTPYSKSVGEFIRNAHSRNLVTPAEAEGLVIECANHIKQMLLKSHPDDRILLEPLVRLHLSATEQHLALLSGPHTSQTAT